MQTVDTFLGAGSPKGFHGYFEQAYGPDWHVWLLKGGPGTGKSTLLRQVMRQTGGSWEQVHCSADPASLDAVICPGKRVMLADATPPHTLEPRWPGCTEHLVDLGVGLDAAQLRAAGEEIRRLGAAAALQHARAAQFLAAAAAVQTARVRAAEADLNETFVRETADRLCRRDWTHRRQAPTEQLRGLSAVTPEGVTYFQNTVTALADTVFALRDTHGAAAPRVLEQLRRGLQGRGVDVITCRCALFPQKKIEHLLLPRQRVAFVTDVPAHPYTASAVIPVELAEGYSVRETARPDDTREQQLSAEAAACMRQARELHAQLEQLYRAAMDFSVADRAAERLTAKIAALPVLSDTD